MPSVSVSNFESDELLSPRLLSFMSNSDQTSGSFDNNVTNGSKFCNNGSFVSTNCSLKDAESNGSNYTRSPLHRNGSIPTMASLQDRVLLNGSPSDVLVSANSTGYLSGSCTPPPIGSGMNANFLPIRNHTGAPPYSALTSPCMGSKLNTSANVQQLMGFNNTNTPAPNECHSLQNSPYYNHYPLNGNPGNQFSRQLGGMSPGPLGNLLPNGVNGLSNLNNGPRNGLYQDTSFPLGASLRAIGSSNGSNGSSTAPNNPGSTVGCPQRELFPTSNSGCVASNVFGSGLLVQDRLRYHALAQKHGFIVGAELERVKENSCRSTSQSYGRIAAHFRHRYGETEAKTKAAYLQIGVRVPSKDHVSEIVGKGGQKIKLIREETGALITTPGEHEEHVFIIEAPPEIAMHVAHHLATRAQEITQSKLAAGERRRGSVSSQTSSGFDGGSTNSAFGPTANGLLLAPSSAIAQSNGTSSSYLTGLGTSGSASATNSPLHPVNNHNGNGNSLTTSLLSTGSNGGMGVLRTPNGNNYLAHHLSSLPSSPGGVLGLNGMSTVGTGVGCSASATQSPSGCSNNSTMSLVNGSLFPSSANSPGSRVLLARSRISVPQEMVGKIIGTQGSIITTIQKDTGTEIKSPPKEAARGPNATSDFEISAYQGLGLSSNQAAECRVQQAKQLIGHLVMRQLERRASEEIDETSGSLSSDEQRLAAVNVGGGGGGGGGGGNTPRHCMGNSWMWPDVAQMDSQEAREVLDRILAESKNKTRRAKEMAAAAAVAGPSPNGPNGGGQSGLVGSNGAMLGMSGVDSGGQHFQLLGGTAGGNGGFFDSVESTNDCSDLSQAINDAGGLFSPRNNHFVNRTSSGPLLDDSQRNGQPCSPRALSGFNLSDPIDLMASFQRGPTQSNLVADLWHNPLSNFPRTGGDASSGSLSHNGTMANDMVNPLHNLLSAGSGPTLNTLFSPTPSSSPHGAKSEPTTTLTKHTSLGHHPSGMRGNFDDSHMSFPYTTATTHHQQHQQYQQQHQQHHHQSQQNHQHNNHHHQQQQQNDSTNGTSSGFGSGGDLSPSFLMQYRSSNAPSTPDLPIHNSLARRHSDWVVNSPNMLLEMSNQRSSAAAGGGGGGPACRMSSEPSQHHQNQSGEAVATSPFASNGGLDFFKALDHLCLTASAVDLSGENGGSPGGGNGSTSISGHCPPGFEQTTSDAMGIMTDPWSSTVTSDADTQSLFLADNRDGTAPLSKASLLRRLLNGPSTTGQSGHTASRQSPLTNDSNIVMTTNSRLSSIWSAPVDSSLTGSVRSDNTTMHLSTDVMDDFGTLSSFLNQAGFIDSAALQEESSAADAGFHASGDVSARCGAIGEGRRRGPRGDQSPSLSLSGELDSITPISVSSAIASITEVA